jgi:hypothetical protein
MPAEIRIRRFGADSRRLGTNHRANVPNGMLLSKACPLLEPFKQAIRRLHCLIFDLKLFDIGRLGSGGFDPFLHL